MLKTNPIIFDVNMPRVVSVDSPVTMRCTANLPLLPPSAPGVGVIWTLMGCCGLTHSEGTRETVFWPIDAPANYPSATLAQDANSTTYMTGSYGSVEIRAMRGEPICCRFDCIGVPTDHTPSVLPTPVSGRLPGQGIHGLTSVAIQLSVARHHGAAATWILRVVNSIEWSRKWQRFLVLHRDMRLSVVLPRPCDTSLFFDDWRQGRAHRLDLETGSAALHIPAAQLTEVQLAPHEIACEYRCIGTPECTLTVADPA